MTAPTVNDRHVKALRWLQTFSQKTGYQATIRELSAGMGWQSPHSGHEVVRRLKAAGLVDYQLAKARTLVVTAGGTQLLEQLAKLPEPAGAAR